MPSNVSLPISPPTILTWRDGALDLIVRFRRLEQIPGGRDALTRDQRLEYDLIGGALSDIRTALATLDAR